MRAAAAATLGCVSDADVREAVVSCGGVEALLSMLEKGDANGELEAIHAICSLADHNSSHAGLSAGIKSLVALASGDGPSQAEAMATVHKLSAGGEAAARAALACSDAAILLLVKQLSSAEAAERTSAMSSLLQLCDREESRTAIVAAGGVAPLVAVAQARIDLSSSTRREAALVLSSLSTAANTNAVATNGGIGVLIAALELSTLTGDGQMTQAAAAALRELVACDAGRSAILSGGVPACVQLLSNESEAVQLDALHVLQVLRTGDDRDGLNTLSTANAAKPLVQLLSDPHAPSVQHGALCLLHRLASIEKESSLQQIVDAGGAPALLPHLSSKESDARDQSLSTLAKVSPLLTHLAVEFNHISTLSCCFIGGTPTRHEHAASVLSLLASDHANAPTILSTGGAQGLLKVSRSVRRSAHPRGAAHARVRASNALKQLAAPLFGAFTEAWSVQPSTSASSGARR